MQNLNQHSIDGFVRKLLIEMVVSALKRRK